MLKVMAVMLSGILAGCLFRRRSRAWLPFVISGFVYLLLLFLGFSIGGNALIMDRLPDLGTEALLLTAGAVLGSVTAAGLIYKWIMRRKA